MLLSHLSKSEIQFERASLKLINVNLEVISVGVEINISVCIKNLENGEVVDLEKDEA